MEPNTEIDEGLEKYGDLSRREKLLLLRLYCHIPKDLEQYFKAVFGDSGLHHTHAYHYFRKRIMDNSDWSQPGEMVVTYRSLPLTLKQWDARFVYEQLDNGKIAFGISRSPFSKEFLKKHEESVLKRAVSYDIDDMMSLAAVLCCCLHCHAAEWPLAVDNFVRVLLLLPGTQSPIPNGSDAVDDYTFLCGIPRKNKQTSLLELQEPPPKKSNDSRVTEVSQRKITGQIVPSSGAAGKSHQPSLVNSKASAACSKGLSLTSGSRKLPFSIDSILQKPNSNIKCGIRSAFKPYVAGQMSNCSNLPSTAPYPVLPCGLNWSCGHPFPFFTVGNNPYCCTTVPNSCGHKNDFIPSLVNSACAVNSDGHHMEQTTADINPCSMVREVVPSHSTTPNSHLSNLNVESQLSPTLRDVTVSHEVSEESYDDPVTGNENGSALNTHPSAANSIPSLIVS
ncbi:hypothetical protein V3C99_003990 [Haemonchus contortus]